MANVFGILTAIILAISAFVALKNKKAHEDTIAQTQTAKETLVKSEARLKADETEMNDTLPGEITALNSDIDKLTADEAGQKKSNDAVTAQVDEKTKKIADNKAKLDAIREKTSKTGDITSLATKMKTMSAELIDLTSSIDAANSKLANLTAQNASSEAQVNTTKSKFEKFAGGESLVNVNTRIRAIYPNWGFVTLAAGNNAGVVANSTLNVVRDGQTIAQLLVTAVESSTASASIVPDSLASDVTLMVGDRVVPGVKSTKPASN